MIELFPFAGFTVAVLGLGRDGLVAATALKLSEATVWAWDDDAKLRERAKEAGIPLVDLHLCDWREVVSLVIESRIPHGQTGAHPLVAAARKTGAEVIGDVELLARAERDSSYIGITGGFDAPLVAALGGHILRLAGREVEVGGLPGAAPLSLHPLGLGGYYVLAMEPGRIDTTLSITFDCAVLLNLAPGEGPEDAARRAGLFHRQTGARAAVVNIDDDGTRAVHDRLAAKAEQVIMPLSARGPAAGGVYVADGMLMDGIGAQAVPVLPLSEVPALAGEAGALAACAGYAAARAIGVEAHQAMACIRSFPGLVNHRELVAIINGVAYVNDARGAGSPAARERALVCYPGALALDPGADLCASLQAAQRAAEDKGSAAVVLAPGSDRVAGFATLDDLGDAFREAVETLPGDHEDL